MSRLRAACLAGLVALAALFGLAGLVALAAPHLPGGREGLPPVTRAAMGFSYWFLHWWWALVAGAALLLGLLRRLDPRGD